MSFTSLFFILVWELLEEFATLKERLLFNIAGNSMKNTALSEALTPIQLLGRFSVRPTLNET